MATWMQKEIVSRRIEYIIDSGSVITDIYKVAAFAWNKYCEHHEISPNTSWPDDWCRIEARDDQIVLTYTIDTPKTIIL